MGTVAAAGIDPAWDPCAVSCQSVTRPWGAILWPVETGELRVWEMIDSQKLLKFPETSERGSM